MKKSIVSFMVFCFLFATLTCGGSAVAGDLPKLISITTFKMGSLGYTITSAFREAIEKHTPMKVRVEPYGPDVARFMPLKKKQSEFTLATGPQATCASYGILNFSKKEWGPQALQTVWNGMTLYVACFSRADSDIKTMNDIKGKRVPFIPGAAAYNTNMASYLAFAGLTWEDVTKVICSSLIDAIEGVHEGKLDIAFTATVPPKVKEVFAGPHGGHWLPLPKSDKAAWARLNAIAPWNVPAVCKRGPGIKEGQGVEMGSFPYALFAYDHLGDDVVYAFVKAMHQGYDIYKDMHRSLKVWTIQQAVSNPGPVPYHAGAIRYYKEAGVWTPELDKWQAEQMAAFEKRLADWETRK